MEKWIQVIYKYVFIINHTYKCLGIFGRVVHLLFFFKNEALTEFLISNWNEAASPTQKQLFISFCSSANPPQSLTFLFPFFYERNTVSPGGILTGLE